MCCRYGVFYIDRESDRCCRIGIRCVEELFIEWERFLVYYLLYLFIDL